MSTTNSAKVDSKKKGSELVRPSEPIQPIALPPLTLSPNADPSAKYPPIRRRHSDHVFYNFTRPITPLPEPNEPPSGSKEGGYLLPEPAVSIAYRKKLDVVE
jgi:hypothetical protein